MPITQERMMLVIDTGIELLTRLNRAAEVFAGLGNNYMALECKNVDPFLIENLFRESAHFKHMARVNERRALANHRRRNGEIVYQTRNRAPQYTPAEREQLHLERMGKVATKNTDQGYAAWNLGLSPDFIEPEVAYKKQEAKQEPEQYEPKTSGVREDGTEWSFGESEELDPAKLKPGQDLF